MIASKQNELFASSVLPEIFFLPKYILIDLSMYL